MSIAEGREVAVAAPGDQAYDEATQVFNLSVPARPAAAVTASTIDHIRAVIRYASSEGLLVRVHATGHGAATAFPMNNAVLIRTQLAGGIEIDAARRIARIPAGTRWGAVVQAAVRHGLAAPHGSSPLVGVVGYLLRGGASLYGRQVGVAANSVRAIELVTADGELRRVDGSSDPQLFNALRGGGGGFGVVTAVEIGLFPVAEVVTGAAFWSGRHADGLVRAWFAWAKDAPRQATTTIRVMNLPPLPEIPPMLAEGPVLCVDGAVLSRSDDEVPDGRRCAEELLGPLRSVAEPLIDTWRPAGPEAVLEAHLDPTEPFPIIGDHMLLNDPGDDGADEFLRAVDPGTPSPVMSVELRQLGGAFAEPSPSGGLLSHFDARYAYIAGGAALGPVTPEALAGRCAEIRDALDSWDTLLTAPSLVESIRQPQGHLSAEQVRLADDVRTRVDPSGLFRGDIAPNRGSKGSAGV